MELVQMLGNASVSGEFNTTMDAFNRYNSSDERFQNVGTTFGLPGAGGGALYAAYMELSYTFVNNLGNLGSLTGRNEIKNSLMSGYGLSGSQATMFLNEATGMFSAFLKGSGGFLKGAREFAEHINYIFNNSKNGKTEWKFENGKWVQTN